MQPSVRPAPMVHERPRPSPFLCLRIYCRLRGDGCVLMLRRATTGWMDGFWSLPAGGLDHGEPLRATAAKELQEEVGLKVNIADLTHAHTLHSLTEGRDWVGHFFSTEKFEGAPRLSEPEKHDGLEWFALSRLPERTIPYVAQALRCAAARELVTCSPPSQ